MGIDPGISGAVAVINDAKILEVFDMPVKDGNVDLYELATFVDGISPQIRMCVIEKVHSMPEQGVASTFKFGFSFGAASGIVAANYVPMVYAAPAAWKGAMGLSKNKKDSLELVRKLFPASLDHFKRVKDNGRAEAVLLAVFGQRQLKNLKRYYG